jgi:hypothetical protein
MTTPTSGEHSLARALTASASGCQSRVTAGIPDVLTQEDPDKKLQSELARGLARGERIMLMSHARMSKSLNLIEQRELCKKAGDTI